MRTLPKIKQNDAASRSTQLPRFLLIKILWGKFSDKFTTCEECHTRNEAFEGTILFVNSTRFNRDEFRFQVKRNCYVIQKVRTVF